MAIIVNINSIGIVRDMAPIYTLPNSKPIRSGNYIKASVEIVITNKVCRVTKEINGEYKFRPGVKTTELFAMSEAELEFLAMKHIISTFIE